MTKRILIFKGGAVVQNDESMNKFDINGQEPIDNVAATKKNFDKYIKRHEHPEAEKQNG